MKKFAKKNTLLFFYIIMIIFWIFKGLITLWYDGGTETIQLNTQNAILHNIQRQADGSLLTTSTDPSIVFEELNVNARRIQIVAQFEDGPGEIDVYYLRSSGFDPKAVDENGNPLPLPFSAKNRSWAVPKGDGLYVYNIPYNKYYALRIDPGTLADNTFKIQSIVINPPMAFWQYFVPGIRSLLFVLLAPGLAYCILYTVKKAGKKGQQAHNIRKSK